MKLNPPWQLGKVKPRRWQCEAFIAAELHLSFHGEPAVIRAIMGAGKSILLAELCATAQLEPGTVIVVSTPTELLVRQLYEDIGKACYANRRRIGIWYGKGKRLGDVIVTCVPSVPALAQVLKKKGLKVALWIADECHKTEAPTIKGAYSELNPALTLGFTATPYRANESDSLTLFKHQIYNYDADAGLRDGVVVPWRIESWTGGESELDGACVEMIGRMEGPGLINAADIKDAEGFAEKLTSLGIRSAAVHSRVPQATQSARISALESGQVRCLVHVNMLAEGANFPWLRWLCLRREVASRVRFLQEAGRILRSHPGKSEAVFLDPHDLFGQFKISYAECLGEKLEDESIEEKEPQERAEAIRSAKDATALSFAEAEIRRLVVACDAAGMLPDRRIMKKRERVKPSNALQHTAIWANASYVREYLAPPNWQPLINALCERRAALNRGFGADLIAALVGIKKANRWPPIDSEGRISGGMESAPAPVERKVFQIPTEQLKIEWPDTKEA